MTDKNPTKPMVVTYEQGDLTLSYRTPEQRKQDAEARRKARHTVKRA